MSSVFRCRYCGGETCVSAGRVYNAQTIRCDRCYALSVLTERDRRDLLAQFVPAAAEPPPPSHRRSAR